MVARLTAQSTALSMGCFVIASAAVLDEKAIEAYGLTEDLRKYLEQEKTKRRSFIMGPWGQVSKESDDELVYGECNLDHLVKTKYGLVCLFSALRYRHSNMISD
jgi:predicted amidohydrolase